jgi:hypothetical protein
MIIEEIKKDINFLREHTLQPKWWKIVKVFILVGGFLLVYFIFGVSKAIIWISFVLVFSGIVHITYRIKTQVYKKSWLDFKVTAVDGKRTYKRIGLVYYSLVVLIFFTATVVIYLL